MAEPTRTPLSLRERRREPRGSELVPAETLKSHLPGVEPERRLNDWGRSERIEGVFDATLVEFFYRHWFRAEVEGIENVPAAGGALLVSNHSGALPPDAAMIGKAIREEHTHPRPLNITVEHFFKGYPGFSMLVSKIGCVPAHPANVHRLLFDEEQLVLVFPEGRKGTKKLSGLIYFPITPTFPHFGLLGMMGYLPAKFRIRFLEPIHFDDEGMHEDKALVQTVAHDVRARIQENLWDMLAKRRSVWFG